MTWTRMGISATGGAAVVSVVLAASAIWVLLNSPATWAVALDQGTLAPVGREIVAVLINVLRHLLAYL